MDEPTSEQRRELDQLVGNLCDNVLTDAQRGRLDEILHDHAWARTRYLSLMDLHGRLTWDCGFPTRPEDTVPQPVELSDRNETVKYPFGLARKLRARNQFILAVSLILAGLIWFAGGIVRDSSPPATPIAAAWPTPRLVPVQATLTRAVNVEWSGARMSPQLGGPTGPQLLRLRSGRVQITFDTGVEVVIEGPAEFSQDGFGGMALIAGTLTAKVPDRGEDFTVLTSSARIASQGATEFGLDVNASGVTELHVMEGTAAAGLLTDTVGFATQHPLEKISEGQALLLDRNNETTAPLVYNSERFATINVHCLDIVDLASGGDGLGNHLIYGIDAVSGKKLLPDTLPRPPCASDSAYHPVTWNPYLDGVFVPSAEAHSIQLDSTGRTYEGLPTTSGECWQGGIAFHRTGYEQPAADSGHGVYNWLQSRSPDALTGLSGAFLGLHANVGLTLDLREIGTIVPNGRLHRFRARLIDLRPDGPGARPPVLWLFLDGEPYASYRPNGLHKSLDIDVPLSSENQFLTLVTTDGDGLIHEDWMVLVNPVFKWLTNEKESI